MGRRNCTGPAPGPAAFKSLVAPGSHCNEVERIAPANHAADARASRSAATRFQSLSRGPFRHAPPLLLNTPSPQVLNVVVGIGGNGENRLGLHKISERGNAHAD